MIEEGWRAKSDIPVMKRIVVEIDPAISVSKMADETGIIVVVLSSDGHDYVLEDASGKMSPIEWARRVKSSGPVFY
jgi:phage terminase large subunit-like protein